MSVLDYVGRTVDILAFHGATPGKILVLDQALVRPGEAGFVVTGVQKLVQRFLITLLTPRGSIRYRPTLGTFLLTDARRGSWRTAADVQQSFYSAALDARRQIVAEETEDDPDDERFGSVALLGVNISSDRVTLRVQLLSQAGTGRDYIVPIPTVL